MLCWLQEIITFVGSGGGRSAKMAPFWTRAWCAIERLDIKIAGLEPMRRVTMGPYLAWRLRRMGSISEKGLRSHRRLPRIGMVNGPGGSFLLELELEFRRNLRMAETQREIRMMSQVSVSMFVFFWLTAWEKKGTVV
jgi:hypothetical protein